MTEKENIDYWVKSSEDALLTAESLFKSKRYHHCLFFCHLLLEKLLKAIYIAKKHDAPPWIHDLNALITKSGLKTNKNMYENLKEINKFNITARYDDYKFSFYKKATREFATEYLQITKEIYQWLKTQLSASK